MPGVLTRLGDDTDDRSRRLAVFRTIGIAQHFELGDRIYRRIDQNRAVRAFIVIVSAVEQEQVIRARVPVHCNVNTTQNALVFSIDATAGSADTSHSGLQQSESDEVLAVQDR